MSNPKSEIRNPKSGGFTLLEVLIAVAIMSGIVTVIYASFSTASRNVEQAEARRDADGPGPYLPDEAFERYCERLL